MQNYQEEKRVLRPCWPVYFIKKYSIIRKEIEAKNYRQHGNENKINCNSLFSYEIKEEQTMSRNSFILQIK